MKLFAWKPKHHGPLSFFVMAESEADALKAVERCMSSRSVEDGGYVIPMSKLRRIANETYKLTVLNPGEVIINAND